MKRIFSLKGIIIGIVIILLVIAVAFYGSIMYDIIVNDIINQ